MRDSEEKWSSAFSSTEVRDFDGHIAVLVAG